MIRRLKHYLFNLPYFAGIAPKWLKSRRAQRRAARGLAVLCAGKLKGSRRDVVAICVCNDLGKINEAFRKHYSKIGVRDFLFVVEKPSASSELSERLNSLGFDVDRTLVVQRPENVEKHHFISFLINKYADSRWALLLNGCEFIIYPNFNSRSLADFCEFMTGERRQGVFGIELDLYRDSVDAADEAGFDPFDGDWYFDKVGYRQERIDGIKSTTFRGGLNQRLMNAQGRGENRSRAVLFRSNGVVELMEDCRFALRRRFNIANAEWHLSPTVCLLSTSAFESLPKHLNGSGKDTDLLTDHSVRFEYSPDLLVRNGLMNRGQWF